MSSAQKLTAIFVAAALAAGAAWYASRDPEAASSAAIPINPVQIIPTAKPAPRTQPAAIPDPASSRKPATANVAVRFRAADDLLDFADSIHDAAKGGDAEAQFYMYRVIDTCTYEYTIYFSRGERERTLDQALILAEQNPGLIPDRARELYSKCRRFKQANALALGQEQPWLESAVKSRYPLAQAVKARQLSRESFNDTGAPQKKAQARELAREALRTGSPEVVYELIEVASTLAASGTADNVYNTWMIAACQRGFDCGQDSEVFRLVCKMDAACQPYETTVDILHRMMGVKFDELERHARELNELIDQGRFDELGL